MTTKILDNTVISASINALPSIELLQICSNRYAVITSDVVIKEAEKGFPHRKLESVFSCVTVHDSQHSCFNETLAWLENRFPYLHKGELSTFLLSVLDFAIDGKRYYYVTDDGKMRKAVQKILGNSEFKKICGWTDQSFNLTGTIGLIKRLHECGEIDDTQIDHIINDLENSTFYISRNLLNSLRGKRNETNGEN